MLRLLTMAALLACVSPTLRAAVQQEQPDPPPREKQESEKPATPEEQFAALAEEFQQARQEFYTAYRQATTPQERSEVLQNEPGRAYGEKFMALAEEHRGTPVALKSLSWILVNARGDRNAVGQAIQRIREDHIADPEPPAEFEQALNFLPFLRVDAAEALLRDLIEKSPQRRTRAFACWNLAEILTGGLRSGNLSEENEREAVALLQRVGSDFADVPSYGRTLGERAEGALFEIRHLRVGKVAPEIEGEDLDGVRFKLSDYRGKVVMLDFWGHW